MAEIRGGYGIVWQCIMRDKRLTPEAKAIYAYLCSFAGSGLSCFPSVDLMCKELRMSEERFGKHMKSLVDLGIVQKERQRNGNLYGRNLYALARSPINQGNENPGDEKQVVESRGVENPGSNITTPNSNSSNNNSIEVYSVRVCELLNQAKGKVNSKGRLRPNNWALQDLIRQGLTIQEIEAVAQDLACTGADITWMDFVRHCKGQGCK